MNRRRLIRVSIGIESIDITTQEAIELINILAAEDLETNSGLWKLAAALKKITWKP